jgi:hypothetical protein
MVEETHKKFSDGKATVVDFEECVKTIVNGGILEFGEIGSGKGEDEVPVIDNTTATGVAQARKIFAEVVSKIQQENPEWDMVKAMSEAARKHPELAETYQVTLPA